MTNKGIKDIQKITSENYLPSKTLMYLQLKDYEKKVSYDDDTHVYYYQNRTLSPTTSTISKFFPKFDSKGISENLAKKELGSQLAANFDYVLKTAKKIRKKWSEKADLGTIVHRYGEFVLNSGQVPFKDIKSLKSMKSYANLGKHTLSNYLKSIDKFLKDQPQVLQNFLYSELIVWNRKFSIAGQVDFITYNFADDSIDLWDWKTSKTITDENVCFNSYGFGALSKLPATNFYKYTLQLSIYKQILELAGFKVNGLKILHLKEKDYKIIDVPYLSDEARYILQNN